MLRAAGSLASDFALLLLLHSLSQRAGAAEWEDLRVSICLKLCGRGKEVQGRELWTVHHHPSVQMEENLPTCQKKEVGGELGPLPCFLALFQHCPALEGGW